VLAVAGDANQAHAAVAAGAGMLDIGAAGTDVIAAIRQRHPDVLLCGQGEAADLVRDADIARRTRAGLICANLPDAEKAAASGIPRERILVTVPPAGIDVATAADWSVLVDASPAVTAPSDTAPSDTAHSDTAHSDRTPADTALADTALTDARNGSLPAEEAVAAVCAWLGATVVRTQHVAEVRRAIDMTESILGLRPPSMTLRGLA
jgi:hypothetical protein